MAESRRGLKTEHSGAKNGGGYWGDRAEAKAVSNKARRENGKDEIRDTECVHHWLLSEKLPGKPIHARCTICGETKFIPQRPMQLKASNRSQ